MKFVDDFESLLKTRSRIEGFRKEEDYQRFWDQWNLPVYFQIRFVDYFVFILFQFYHNIYSRYQEIGQVLESRLSDENRGFTLSSGMSDFKMESFKAVWESLVKCFDSQVFLLPLLHRFWKLTLLILSRHRSWIIQSTKAIKVKQSYINKENSRPFFMVVYFRTLKDLMGPLGLTLTTCLLSTQLFTSLVTLMC